MKTQYSWFILIVLHLLGGQFIEQLDDRRTYIRDGNTESTRIPINNDKALVFDADSLTPRITDQTVNTYRELLPDGTVMIVEVTQ